MQNDTVCTAINNKRLLRIWYDPGERLIEPHTHGDSNDDNSLLRAYQVSGASKSGEPTDWKMFRLDRADSIVLTDETFPGPRPGYRRGDSAMARIHCEL